jgi:hypothetical protein
MLADFWLVDAAADDGFADVAVFLFADYAFDEQASGALTLADVAGFHRLAGHFDFHSFVSSSTVMPNQSLEATAGSPAIQSLECFS